MKDVISRSRIRGRVCFVSYLNVLTTWKTLSGRSAWLLIQSSNMGYMAVSLVGRRARGSSSWSTPALSTQKTSFSKSAMCSASFISSVRGIRSGNSASPCPVERRPAFSSS